MDKEQAFYWAIDQRIAQIYRLYILYDRIQDKLKEEYGWKDKDLRTSFFIEMARGLYNLTLLCRLARGGALNEQWMKESMPSDQHYDTDTLKQNFNHTLAHLDISSWLLFHSIIEDKFQQLYKKIFQQKGTIRTPLPHIAKRVLKKVDAPFPPTLFGLLHQTHASIHGTQFYFRGKAEKPSIEYRDKTYKFKGGRLKFDTFSLLLHIVEDLAGIYVNIVRSEQVHDWSFTWDPHFREK